MHLGLCVCVWGGGGGERVWGLQIIVYPTGLLY